MNWKKYLSLFLTEFVIVILLFLLLSGYFIYISSVKQDSYNRICGTDISLYESLNTDLDQGCIQSRKTP